jgi:hypothetical protein
VRWKFGLDYTLTNGVGKQGKTGRSHASKRPEPALSGKKLQKFGAQLARFGNFRGPRRFRLSACAWVPSGHIGESCSLTSTFADDTSARRSGMASKLSGPDFEAGGMPLQREQVAAMSDPYFEAIKEQWPNIRALYKTYESKKPVILYDIQEEKIYAYPYKDFKAEMGKKSQASLERQYKSASVHGSIIVFVRDNTERKLLSYTMSKDNMIIQ